MKKIMMMVTMMVATLTASAQLFEPGTFTVQPRIGLTGSVLTNMHPIGLPGTGKSIDDTAIAGFILGADLEYQLTPKISLSAGLNWAQAGTGWKDYSEKIDYSGIKADLEMKDIKIQTSYLNVPVTANFYVWKGLALRAGVQMGFLTSGKAKATYDLSYNLSGVSHKETEEFDESVKDDLEKMDISIPVGLSYEFNNHLVIDARYNIGLTKVNKAKEEKDSRNGVFALTLGYKFKL